MAGSRTAAGLLRGLCLNIVVVFILGLCAADRLVFIALSTNTRIMHIVP